VAGFFATITVSDGRMLLYRGGAKLTLVADLPAGDVHEDLFDNGQGTWLPAIVLTVADGIRLGFYPRQAGLIPDAAKVRSIVATLRNG
jgi:hypothetical protein